MTNGKITADDGKNDDLIMSLASTIFLLHTLADGSPLEMKQNNTEKERKPLEPYENCTIHDNDSIIELEEDLRWLMK